MGLYPAWNCNYVPKFRDNLSVPSSRVKYFNKNAGPLKMGLICYTETSVRDNYTLRQIAEFAQISFNSTFGQF